VDASEFGINVVCWRKLARGVAQSLHKGDPVLVIGKVSDRHFTGTDGQPRWLTELTADFVGPDLSQGIAGRFTRFTHLDRLAAREGEMAADATASDSAAPGAEQDEVDDDSVEEGAADADFGSQVEFTSADEAVLETQPAPAAF
jgi:single-strand DNA-binding protein